MCKTHFFTAVEVWKFWPQGSNSTVQLFFFETFEWYARRENWNNLALWIASQFFMELIGNGKKGNQDESRRVIILKTAS